jgi:inner membrane protein
MDNLTHGLLGIAVAVCVVPRESIRPAAVVGFLAGEFPDLDVFLRSASDPLFALEMHRHFSHSLLMAPVIGAAMAWLVIHGQRWRKRLCNGKALLVAGVMAALSHGLCDVWTSYGTRWYWPFADTRVAWDLISVIDPLFTLPLLLPVCLAIKRRTRTWAVGALVWAMLYLCCSVLQQVRVLIALNETAVERGHDARRLTVKPSFGNIIVWRALYECEGEAHVLCFRAMSEVKLLGESRAVLVKPMNLREIAPGSVLARDIERFAHFSDGWLGWHPQQPGILGDLRYAMRPDAVSPLWGIVVDASKPDAHASFATFRRTGDESWQVLWRMIRNGTVP